MKKQTQKTQKIQKIHKQAEDPRPQLKCDACGTKLHKFELSGRGRPIDMLIDWETVACGVKFTICKDCRDTVSHVLESRGWSEMSELELAIQYLDAKLNRVIEALREV